MLMKWNLHQFFKLVYRSHIEQTVLEKLLISFILKLVCIWLKACGRAVYFTKLQKKFTKRVPFKLY